jgi:hypothetical protein
VAHKHVACVASVLNFGCVAAGRHGTETKNLRLRCVPRTHGGATEIRHCGCGLVQYANYVPEGFIEYGPWERGERDGTT